MGKVLSILREKVGTQESSPGLATPHLNNKQTSLLYLGLGGFTGAKGRKRSEEWVSQRKLTLVSQVFGLNL